MAEINIDMKGLGDKALRIKKINLELKEEFKKIENEMNHLDGIWESATYNLLKRNFKEINEKVGEFYLDLDAYAKFLKNTAEAYGYVEKKIKTNAESFID